ncbi:riboflavin kinase [Kineococcus rhizosphaerae]|uniref:riboflavin kinase n=1 Tax=Kineococcus rhizosphaerae TaxID=559628 RepID=A0A2T0QYC5_9ACTN|nr:riboflavin kinase [Kineococcus rhizosphaerae]PRY11201.1 riboflavin kinase/FMN adenylyltransferase [Kineococcus rhizosphaerae]
MRQNTTDRPDPTPTTPPVEVPVPRGDDVALRIEGVVEHGDERGRLLGFPTANVAVPPHALKDGVWAGTVLLDPGPDGTPGTLHVAAVSVGHRPTYYGKDGERLLEANLLDYDGDLYGRTLRIDLHVRLRPQRRCTGSTELVELLRRDVQDTRRWARDTGLGHLLTGRDRSR